MELAGVLVVYIQLDSLATIGLRSLLVLPSSLTTSTSIVAVSNRPLAMRVTLVSPSAA